MKEPLLYRVGADDSSIGFCKDYLFWTLHMVCVPLVLSQVFSQLFLAEGESVISAVGIAQGFRPVVSFHYASRLMKRLGSIINGGIAVMAGWLAPCIAHQFCVSFAQLPFRPRLTANFGGGAIIGCITHLVGQSRVPNVQSCSKSLGTFLKNV